MGITAITRDYGDNVSIVRITTTDALATVSAANYILNQVANIDLVNSGPFTWLPSDMTLVYGSDGWLFATISSDFKSLTPFAFSKTFVGSPAVVGDFAVFATTTGNLEDLGYLPSNASKTRVVMANAATVPGDIAVFSDVNGTVEDSGITAASVAALLAGGGGVASSSVRSETYPSTGATATTVISDAAISASSVVIARFISSANVVTVQTVLPGSGTATVTTDTAPGASVIEYISFTPSAALLEAGVVVGKGSYGGGSATFVISDANITAGMVVTTNFESQVTPSKVYTALAGAGTITFVCSANPGVCVIDYAAMLPGDIAPLSLHAENYSYAGGFASIAISDPSITAASIVTAEFKSQSVVALIQKVTPSAGLLTVLASIDPGPSVVAYIATAAAGGGSGTSTTPQLTSVSTSSATPGTIRAITGTNTNVAATMTSGNLAGVRGAVDLVGASGGFVYGVQGKVIPTGSLSGSVWAPAVFGQYDLSGATINGGQIAAVWGDMGATGGTFTNVTGARLFAGTNTIASLTLNSMIYLYGKATNLFELSGSSGTYITAGAATPSGDLKKIAITIDGVVHYILAATVWS